MKSVDQIEVSHRLGVCQLHIGEEALRHDDLRRLSDGRPALVITDRNVAATRWLLEIREQLPHAAVLVLPSGESAKTLQTVETIWSELAERRHGRDVLLLALGGGVVGDMTGFAAACWMRGVDFVQLPTTLLAQVDASIGGKTGVDLPAGKNLIGAFHQPRAVFIDTRTLGTLPDREFRAGLAEIVKAALLADPDLFQWLVESAASLRARDENALRFAIRRSCEIKADIVASDEHERGKRAWLNLGHTFGHAIEQLTGYERLLHGEAVAIGLVLATELSERTCGLDPALRPGLIALLEAFGLPVRLPAGIEPAAMLGAMRLDKKHRAAAWRLVLLRRPGDPVVHEFGSPEALRELLEANASS